MKDLQVSQIDKAVKTVSKWAEKCNYPGKVNRDNIGSVIKALAENHTDRLGLFLERGYELAVRQYEYYTSPETKHFEENYHLITDNLDNILAFLDIETDYPGLYPSYELTRNGKKFTEYNSLNALKQYNNFWGHW